MVDEVFLALLIKKVEERLENLPVSSRLRGPRGQRGQAGKDGKDFSLEEHKAYFEELAKAVSLKFEDFTEEQISQLRGPRGRDGRDGEDGKDFSLEEHKAYFEELAKSFALKFEDFTEEQIAKLRGPQGRDGRDGKDFDLELHREKIFDLLKEAVSEAQDSLKLKFEDLSPDEIEKLRGPRGRDGRDGKNFVFEEHREFFDSLRPKFSDFTPEERESLRLKFSDLTPSERDSLKLRFSDLTDEDRLSLRGARGARGQRGSQGARGEKGDTIIGPRGLPGAVGPRGFAGRDGIDGNDGRDGKDAPYITDIRLEENRGEISFVFEFSDGTYIETDSVKLPHATWTVVGGGSSGGEGGGEEGPEGPQGPQGKSAYEVAVENGFEGTEEEWVASLVGPQGPQGESGSGAMNFSASLAPDEVKAVDSVAMGDFSAVEFSIALKSGTTRSFIKLVAQKNDTGDYISEWEVLDDISPIGGEGVDVEKVWESSSTLDLSFETTVVGSDMILFFTNNEETSVEVSGLRQPIPDFA